MDAFENFFGARPKSRYVVVVDTDIGDIDLRQRSIWFGSAEG